MRIAVIEHVASKDYTEYIFSLIEEAAKQHDYQLKVWSSSVPASQQKTADNAVIFISVASTSNLLLNWLYKVKIPSTLKKMHADVVIDLNGVAEDKIKIPQLLAMAPFMFSNDINKLNKIEKFAYKNRQHALQTASNILLYDEERKQTLTNTDKQKLHTIFFTASEAFRTYEWHDKIMVKAQHADNKDYFLAVIEDENVEGFVLLMQAFSKFKKWQQSNMQLIILPKYEFLGAGIHEKHKTYKYRDDVRLIEEIDEREIATIFASAYAFVHLAANFAQLFLIAIALQCSLPIISFNDEDVKAYAGNAALYFDEKSADTIGAIFIQLYKDENLQKQLHENAAKQAAKLKRNESIEKLWKLIEATSNKK